MTRILSLISLLLFCTASRAQDDPEYQWEVGVGLGTIGYTGDFNSALFRTQNMALDASLMVRRVFNPYSHMRMALSYGTIKGRSGEVGNQNGEDTFYPDYNTPVYSESAREEYRFSNPLIGMDFIYEYNFWPYGTGRDYRGAVRVTPFVAIGLGFNYAVTKGGYTIATEIIGNNSSPYGKPETTGKGAFTANMPLGFGVKYKAAPRLNLSLEWMMHFSLSDKLDGVEDPYRIASTGIFKNTDCYNTLQLSLTYSFGPKCRTCMNSDWHQ